MRKLLLIIVLLQLTFSCDTASDPDESGMTADRQARHWVHDARLRDIMGQLERQHRSLWSQEIEDEKLKQQWRDVREFDDAASAAADLAATADHITAIVARMEMYEVDRRSFMAQVETLEGQAKRLREAAEMREFERMEQILGELEATCTSCHQRFRDIAGPLRS